MALGPCDLLTFYQDQWILYPDVTDAGEDPAMCIYPLLVDLSWFDTRRHGRGAEKLGRAAVTRLKKRVLPLGMPKILSERRRDPTGSFPESCQVIPVRQSYNIGPCW